MKDVIDALARVETKVDDLREDKRDHETRIRSLERWRWVLVGGGVVIIFVVRLVLKA